MAYYFAALALGLPGGVVISPDRLAPALLAGVLLALFVGDGPWLFARYRGQTVTLDAPSTDEPELIARLEGLLGARVHRNKVRRVDLVEATTTIEARYELIAGRAEAAVRAPGVLRDGSR